MAASGQNNLAQRGIDDSRKYEQAWAEMMVTIWRDKIDKLHVIDSYRLRQTVEHNVLGSADSVTTISHKFMKYGIFQDVGVGWGYKKRNNGGNLEFLDPVYRIEHELDEPRKRGPVWGGGYTSGKPRKPREWFSRAYFASIMVLRDEMAHIFAESFTGLLVDAISLADNGKSTSMRSRLWGHHEATRGVWDGSKKRRR